MLNKFFPIVDTCLSCENKARLSCSKLRPALYRKKGGHLTSFRRLQNSPSKTRQTDDIRPTDGRSTANSERERSRSAKVG